jgi:hypothetical protein
MDEEEQKSKDVGLDYDPPKEETKQEEEEKVDTWKYCKRKQGEQEKYNA